MANYKTDYLPTNTKRRSGKKLAKVLFIVAHDTGNDGSTAQANVNYYKRSANDESASAHIFIDDKDIIECIPLTEKAWHVRYQCPQDNALFNEDANDAAIGVELCYSTKGKFDSNLAYVNYVGVLADLCKKYGLVPSKHIVVHEKLDPGRKTDPTNALSKIGKSFDALIVDIERALAEITPEKPKAEVKPAHKLSTLKIGDKGDNVKRLQKLVGVKTDGDFGPATEKAVKLFQTKNNLKADGIVGSKTWGALL
jgi:N-acetylmuramoyl-L-alanine amidase CwlA